MSSQTSLPLTSVTLRCVFGLGREKEKKKKKRIANLPIQTYFNCCASKWKCRHIIIRVGQNEENASCWGKTSTPSSPIPSPKPYHTQEKVQCNYNNIIAFHQSTITSMATWGSRVWGLHRVSRGAGQSPFLLVWLHEEGEGVAKLFDIFLLPIFQEFCRFSYTHCAHASCQIGALLFSRQNSKKCLTRTTHDIYQTLRKFVAITHNFLPLWIWRAVMKIVRLKSSLHNLLLRHVRVYLFHLCP